MKQTRNRLWLFTKVMAILLSVLTFTPLVIPTEKFTPVVFGMPYTLWAGLAITILFVLNAWFATYVHPGNNND